jgi:hypothetical protein
MAGRCRSRRRVSACREESWATRGRVPGEEGLRPFPINFHIATRKRSRSDRCIAGETPTSMSRSVRSTSVSNAVNLNGLNEAHAELLSQPRGQGVLTRTRMKGFGELETSDWISDLFSHQFSHQRCQLRDWHSTRGWWLSCLWSKSMTPA